MTQNYKNRRKEKDMTSLQERWQLKTTWEKMMLRDLKRKIEFGLSESEMG